VVRKRSEESEGMKREERVKRGKDFDDITCQNFVVIIKQI
jgi:hypothetical protein